MAAAAKKRRGKGRGSKGRSAALWVFGAAALLAALTALPHRRLVERRLQAARAWRPPPAPRGFRCPPPQIELPGPATVPLRVAALIRAARRAGLGRVEAATRKPRRVSALADRAVVVDVFLTAEGAFAGVYAFARALEGFPAAVLGEATVEPAPKAPGKVRLKGRVELLVATGAGRRSRGGRP